MFEHMKTINKLVSKKIMDIENEVTKSESIFVDEINKLLKNKREIDSYQQKSQYHNRDMQPNTNNGDEANNNNESHPKKTSAEIFGGRP